MIDKRSLGAYTYFWSEPMQFEPGELLLTDDGRCVFECELEDGLVEVTFITGPMTEKRVSLPKDAVASLRPERISRRRNNRIPVDFSSNPIVSLLKSLRVNNYLYWSDVADTDARDWFALHNIPIGRCHAGSFGRKGGFNPQRQLCGRVTVSGFRNNSDLEKVFSALRADNHRPTIIEGQRVIRIRVNGYRIAAGLAKAGFEAHS
jgi:hypothetical protein